MVVPVKCKGTQICEYSQILIFVCLFIFCFLCCGQKKPTIKKWCYWCNWVQNDLIWSEVPSPFRSSSLHINTIQNMMIFSIHYNIIVIIILAHFMTEENIFRWLGLPLSLKFKLKWSLRYSFFPFFFFTLFLFHFISLDAVFKSLSFQIYFVGLWFQVLVVLNFGWI